MKSLSILPLLLLSTAQAAPYAECEAEKMGLKITITQKQDSDGNRVFDAKVKPRGGRPEMLNNVEYMRPSRETVQGDEYLTRIMKAAGLNDVEEFISAEIFITDENSIGKSGLMVFRGGRRGIVGMAYFASPIDFAEACVQ